MATVYLGQNESYIAASASVIKGATGGNESVTILGTPSLTFDANIENITFPGNVADFTYAISGTTITFYSGGNALATILGLEQVTTCTFNDGAKDLQLEGLNAATFGGSAVPTTPGVTPPTTPPTTVSADVGTLGASVSLDASGGSYIYTDEATVANRVVISNFTSNDSITISGDLEAEYQITNDGTDVIITHTLLGTEIVSEITLLGVVQTSDTIYDQSTFEAAIGFDAISFA